MTTPATAPAETPTTPVYEDFIDIFYAPASVFARRALGNPWIPLVALTLVLGTLYLANSRLLEPLFEAEFERSMAASMRANPQLTPEMMEQGRAFGSVMAKVGAFVAMPFVILLTGLALWLAGKVVSAQTGFKTAVLVAGYAMVPRVLESLLAGLQGLLLDPEAMDGRFRVSLGIGRFMDPDTASPVLLAVLGRVDVFTIWVTVLLVIGLSVTGKVSRANAAVAGAIVWVLGALPTVLPALRA